MTSRATVIDMAGLVKRLVAFTVLAAIFTLAPLALFFVAFTVLPGWGA